MGRCSANSGCKQYFSEGHIFDQVVLLAVMYDSNNNQIILSYVVVTSETEGNWVWFRDRKSTRLNSSHRNTSRMPSSA